MFMNKDPEDWPEVNALITFFSMGFPYSKMQRYIERVKPFLINDYAKQSILWDRRQITKVLRKYNIPTADYLVVNRRVGKDPVSQDELETFSKESSGRSKIIIAEAQKRQKEYLTEEGERGFVKGKLPSVGEDDESEEEHDEDEESKEDIIYEDPTIGFIETVNYIELNGKRLHKPFLEKPVNGEDHEIRIYYKPTTCGNGYAVLFRKIDNYCS